MTKRTASDGKAYDKFGNSVICDNLWTMEI